jgi:hypothetical protein
MQAVGTKNRTSLHSIDGSAFKTRGSLSIGRGGHVRKRRRGSLSFGISITARGYCIIDLDSAYQLRRRALEIALEEQSLAEQYGSMVSRWIDEGFNKVEE